MSPFLASSNGSIELIAEGCSLGLLREGRPELDDRKFLWRLADTLEERCPAWVFVEIVILVG